ncbi:hypothetical protein GCM10009546_03470 [Actinomadura livida]|uniref:Transposase IS701-like DDE domain-containing protein n=1 Tax=Actinomadura livida TaxID=79909 RepID=A0ABP3NHP4_9ACTN|nr:hypothetical protein GCM10010208_29710 [Actinomadura livida]
MLDHGHAPMPRLLQNSDAPHRAGPTNDKRCPTDRIKIAIGAPGKDHGLIFARTVDTPTDHDNTHGRHGWFKRASVAKGVIPVVHRVRSDGFSTDRRNRSPINAK